MGYSLFEFSRQKSAKSQHLTQASIFGMKIETFFYLNFSAKIANSKDYFGAKIQMRHFKSFSNTMKPSSKVILESVCTRVVASVRASPPLHTCVMDESIDWNREAHDDATRLGTTPNVLSLDLKNKKSATLATKKCCLCLKLLPKVSQMLPSKVIFRC